MINKPFPKIVELLNFGLEDYSVVEFEKDNIVLFERLGSMVQSK